MAYAAKTDVPVERSRAEIRRALKAYGADQLFDAEASEPVVAAVIGFRAHGRLVRMTLPLPDPADPQFTRTPTGRPRTRLQAEREHEQAVRQRWRALLLVIKAKFEAIEAGVETFETSFAPYLLLPGGQTVGEWLVPQLDDVYASGEMPALLPGIVAQLPPGS